MGLMKLFERWMLFSTALTLQIAVRIMFSCVDDRGEPSYTNPSHDPQPAPPL